jgi:hypothetical protein
VYSFGIQDQPEHATPTTKHWQFQKVWWLVLAIIDVLASSLLLHKQLFGEVLQI